MSSMVVALVREVFPDEEGADRRLCGLLGDARGKGAELAILPELPLMPWRPAEPTPRADDAEPLGGPTFERLAKAARAEAIAVLGGAIVTDPDSGRRYNTALLFDAYGNLAASYRKVHLPHEPGFWEQAHFDAGDDPPRVIHGFPMPLGIQICSDVNRPEGSHLLAAQGAEALLCPRATEAGTFPRWRTVLTANALVSGCWVLSVPRPRPEGDVPLGGPSVVIAPDGTVVVESEDLVSYVEIERDAVERARAAYPGYLAVRPDLYARGWGEVSASGVARP